MRANAQVQPCFLLPVSRLFLLTNGIVAQPDSSQRDVVDNQDFHRGAWVTMLQNLELGMRAYSIIFVL
jgi:hypothetical protein